MLKFLFGILFFSTSIVAVAQLQDDFNDGDFSNNPSWSGDAGDFAVSAAGQLQLNAAAAGESYLSLPFPVMGNGAVEWRFFIRENFSPSSGNYARVYLFLDSVNLENSGNGYYLQFGESLANDAVELFRQDSSSSISICRASDGQIASAFSLGVKVTRDEIGVWTLWLDPTGGTNYAPAASGAEGMYTPGGFFGIACTYTSGNRQNFFFDDFFVGPLMPDTLLPELSSLIATTDRNLEVRFTEIVDPVSGGVSGNYLVNQQVGMPANAWRDTLDLSLVHLDFNFPFPPSTLLSITVSGVKDLSGNAISPGSSGDFIYYPPIQAEHADVIFTEIMFEPSSGSILPNAEFVEVLNRRADAIPVKNWTLSDGSSTAVFPDQILLPGTYLILCAPDNKQAFAAYGTVIGLNSFPGLNNDSGDQLELRDEHGRLIDKILFNNNTYHSDQKDDGGWSLERIDTSFLCEDDLNWRASSDSRGGTPGIENSVNAVHTDLIAPLVLRAYLSDSTHVLAVLNKIPDENSAAEMNNYSFYSGNQFLGHPLAFQNGQDPNKIILSLPFVAGDGIYELKLAGSFMDCPGNRADTNRAVRFAFPEPVMKGDVVINEILFHPVEGNVDFAELYNCSQKILDMKDWRVGEGDFEAPEILISNERITEESVLLFPGDYFVITENPGKVLDQYRSENPYALFDVPDLPDFNSTEGEIVLLDPVGEILDAFIYSEEMHFPLLTNTAGVSLERLSPNLSSDAADNWHSASSLVGFASPGYKNSINFIESGSAASVKIEPEVFSPDNDGIDDLLFIYLQQNEVQTSGKVLIFDTEGRYLRTLANQSLFGSQSLLIWDGLTEEKEPVGPGMYIVYGDFYDTKGNTNHFKKVCTVAYR